METNQLDKMLDNLNRAHEIERIIDQIEIVYRKLDGDEEMISIQVALGRCRIELYEIVLCVLRKITTT